MIPRERKTKTMQMLQSMYMSSPLDNHNSSLVHHTENTAHDSKLMAKLLDAVMVKVKKAYPATKYDDNLRDRLQEQLNQLLPTLQTPDHPPYAFMIQKAIKELNEEGGSSEEAISKFIKATYKDLPWGHCSLLKHHLKKMKEAEAIISVSGNSYVLPSNCNSPGTLEQKENTKKRHCQIEERNRKHKLCRREEFMNSQYIAVHKPELANIKKEFVIKQEQTPLLFKATEEQDQSEQNGPGVTSGLGKGSDKGDGGKVIRLEDDKINIQKEREEVEILSIPEGNLQDCHKAESLKEGLEENLPATREGNQKDQPVRIAVESLSGELNVDSNGQKVPKESRLACSEKVPVLRHCGGASQEILEQCEQINNPVNKSEMKVEQQGVIVEKQTQENCKKYTSIDDLNSLGKHFGFIENENQAQKEQQPVVIVQTDQSQDRQQVHVEASQEILEQRQQINNPVNESGTEVEQQGVIVEKQTQESHEKYASLDDSKPLGNNSRFIENKNQVQKEQQPVVIVQKDQSWDRQQVHGGVSQQILEQCQQVNNPVSESRTEVEQQGVIVVEQTQESHEKNTSVDDSNPPGKDIENKNQVQKEQQPVIIVQKDQSQDRQQVQMVKQTECYRHYEMVEQSKPLKEQGNQVTFQKDALLRPIDIVIIEENLADRKRQTDVMEEEFRGGKRENGSSAEFRSTSSQQVETIREQNEGGKHWDDAIGLHVQHKRMVVEEMENHDNSLMQHNSSAGREIWEQEHQFKAINVATLSRKSEDHLLERQGGPEVISSCSKPLFASRDLKSFGSSHPEKEKCLEFLRRTIKLQEEFNERTIRLQEEYNKKIISLQEQLLMELTLGESLVHTTDHAVFDSRQNAGLRDSAGLYQQPEVGIQAEAPVLHMIESSGHADVRMHQLPAESQQLSASNSKWLPEFDLSVPENVPQRGEKRPRVSDHQGQESNSHGFSNVMMMWLVQFEKRLFDALGRLSEPKLDRLEKSSLREHDAQRSALPEIMMKTIQPSLCQIGKELLRVGSTEGHSSDPVPQTLEPSCVLLEEQGQQLHEKTPCQVQRSKLGLMTLHQQTQAQQLFSQGPKRDESVAATHSVDLMSLEHPSTSNEHHQPLLGLEGHVLRNSKVPNSMEKENSNAWLQEHTTVPHKSQDNFETIAGQPGRALGMVEMHAQQQQQLDMWVSGKELRSRVISPSVASYGDRGYTLPSLGNSSTIIRNSPYCPPLGSGVNGNLVQALPTCQSRCQQLQESSAGGYSRGRGRGRGRVRVRGSSASQISASMTTSEQAISPSQSTPKRRGRPRKTNDDLTDVVSAS